METEDSIGETFEYIMNTPFDQVNIKILDYMADSELYERLPSEKRGTDRHIFACKENGLNDFPLEVLKTKIKYFQEQFRQSRENALKRKDETIRSSLRSPKGVKVVSMLPWKQGSEENRKN